MLVNGEVARSVVRQKEESALTRVTITWIFNRKLVIVKVDWHVQSQLLGQGEATGAD